MTKQMRRLLSFTLSAVITLGCAGTLTALASTKAIQSFIVTTTNKKSSLKKITAIAIGTLNGSAVKNVPASTTVSELLAALTISDKAISAVYTNKTKTGTLVDSDTKVVDTMAIKITAEDNSSAYFSIGLAPTWVDNFPIVSNVSSISKKFNIDVKGNQNGTAYVVALVADAPEPSIAQILKGTDSSDKKVLSAHVGISKGKSKVLTLEGPTWNTSYNVYAVLVDSDKYTTGITKLTVTTPLEPSHSSSITAFSLASQTGDTVIDATKHTIILTVPYGTVLKNTIPSALTISDNATISPALTSPQNFSSAVNYTVTAQDGSTKTKWSVKVNPASGSIANDFLTFTALGQVGDTVIDKNTHTISLEVAKSISLKTIIPTFTVSDKATVNIASGISKDFTKSVIYTVKSQSGKSQTWTIIITNSSSTSTDITAPLLTLTGSSTVLLGYGSAYEDEGAIAIDDGDGDITSKIVKTYKKGTTDLTTIDTTSIGTYTETYSVSDAAGNISQTTRSVLVSKDIIITDSTDITLKFTDDNFRNAVYALIGKTSPEPVLYSDVKNIKKLNLSSLNISNLGGIEYFTALDTLWCQNNQLVSLDVSKNTTLNYLDCKNNKLKNLNVSNDAALTYLACSNNQLSTIGVSNNIALNYLECNNNELTILDVSKNIALDYLALSNNYLSKLDVSNNIALTYLECNNNKLSTLNTSKNTELYFLAVDKNKLTTLDLSNNTVLTILWCKENKLTTLDLSKNILLEVLVCSYNQITTLYSNKDTWDTWYYRPQYTGSTRTTTTDNLVITIKN